MTPELSPTVAAWKARALAACPQEVPDLTRDNLIAWALYAQWPGDFGEAVLSNDLGRATWRADRSNRAALATIAAWVSDALPASCHGSAKAVASWSLLGGLVPPSRLHT